MKKILIGLLLLGNGIGHSDSLDYRDNVLKSKSNDFPDTHFFGAFTAGADFSDTKHSQTLSILPPFSNHYTSNTSHPGSGLLGLTLGLERRFSERYSWQLGLSGYFNTAITSGGHVWQFALPEYDNFLYEYRIQSKRLMATGKLLSTAGVRFHPYVSGELGAGFNRASNYKETPLIAEAVSMAPFMNHTNTSLAWAVGAGIDMDINSTLRLGLGYQFVDLGKVSLGRSPAQLAQYTFSLPHLYSQELRFQLTASI